MISVELHRMLKSDAERLKAIMYGLRSDKTPREIEAAINDLLRWLMAWARVPLPATWPVQFQIMKGTVGGEIPEKIDFVASSNRRRIRLKPWAKSRAFELTSGRTPVPGVHHMALVLLHEVGHVLHHTEARQVYFGEVWRAVTRNPTIPSPVQFSEMSEFFADHMALQIASQAVRSGYADERFLDS